MNKGFDIPVSVLDLSPIRKGATAADALHHSLALARAAEQWGYHRYWVAEHHGMPGIASSATSLVIGYIAQGTSKIRVGSGGIMLPNHAPLVIAEQFGTLASLYPDRIDLGLGRAPGTDQLTARALRRGPASFGEDFPERLQELMAYFTADAQDGLQRVRAIPGEGEDVPIWLLGSSDFSAELAGKLGLPFAFASHFSPQFTLPALTIYRSSFQASRVLSKPYAMVGVNVIAADSDEEANLLSTSMQQQFLGLIRGRPGQLQPPVSSMDGLWTAHEEALFAERRKTTFIGSQETVSAQMASFLQETAADEVIINAQIYDPQARLHSYEIVASLFQTTVGS